MPALKRIGHKGADLIAPGNTLASFDAALAAGVDMVEFDVLPEHPDRSGRLVLAHDFEAAARHEPLTLEQGLAHFAQDAWEGVELDVDLKTTGYELRVVDALREYGLAERALISTMEQESLRVIRAAAPEIRLGWSVPKLRRDYMANPVTRVPALVGAQYIRTVLPGQAARAIRAGRIDAVMSHWALVTRRLARAVDAGRRRALRVDRRRRDADRQARRARGHRDHHQRSAAVRYRMISHDDRDTRR